MGNLTMRHIKGTLKCPMITFWIFFAIHFIYLVIIFSLKKYISLTYLILDIEILFNIEITALFTTLSNSKNNVTLYKTSLALSNFNALVTLYMIFLTVFAFFAKETLIDFINAEPWIEKDCKQWMGLLLIFEKIIFLIPCIILIIFLKRLSTPLGEIEPRNLTLNKDKIALEPDDDKLI